MSLEIILKSKDYIVVNKPVGIPSQSDKSYDEDALTITKQMLGNLGEVSDLWLVHRLDRVVGGLIVFARNKQAAAKISQLVGGHGMEKEYLAVVEGELCDAYLTDYIYKDAAKGKAFIADSARNGAKEAALEYSCLGKAETERGVYTLVRIKLHTGRFHQIRVQFASRKHPIVGDGKYGSHDNRAKTPALHSLRLAFVIGKENIDVSSLPDTFAYPWTLFKEIIK